MSPPTIIRYVRGTALWLIFSGGIAATILLGISTREAGIIGGRNLATLLAVNEIIFYLLLVGIADACWRIFRYRVVLVRNLTITLIMQLAIAITIAIAPLWYILTDTEQYYGQELEQALVASSAMSDSILKQEVQVLKVVSEEVKQLWQENPQALDAQKIDELRLRHGLDAVAIIGGSDRPIISPPDAKPPEQSNILLQLASDSIEPQLKREAGNLIKFEWLVPLQNTAEQILQGEQLPTDNPFGLWLVLFVDPGLSNEMYLIEKGLRGFNNSRSLRTGIREGIQLVVYNAIAILGFASLNLGALLGGILSRRLNRLSSKMEEVASQEVPISEVAESGADEITTVSKAFNEMVRRVSSAIEREQRQRAMLATIQDRMDAGLLVLDGKQQITAHNPAAVAMLRGELEATEFGTALKADTRLASLARRQPETAEFVNWVLAAKAPASGEVGLGKSKLQIRTAEFEVPGNPQPRVVVLFTDISQPLAAGESKVREDAFNFTLHGINNPLQAALIQAELLQRNAAKLTDDASKEKINAAAGKILHQLERIHKQTTAWGQLSGMKKFAFVAVDLNQAITEMLDHAELGTLAVTTELDPQLALIKFDKNMLQDALENLLANAKDQFKLNPGNPQHIKISTSMQAQQVVLNFGDNAGGFDANVLPHIFKPHKSFKAGGHGIGLARVRESLSQAHATITADNIETPHGRGAQFTITFVPADSTPPPPQEN